MCPVTITKMVYDTGMLYLLKEQMSSFPKTSLFNRQGLGKELNVVMVMRLHVWFYCIIPREWLVHVTCSNKTRYKLSVGAFWVSDTNREFNHWLSELWFGVSWKTWHRAVKDTAADISRIISIKSGDFQQKKKQTYDYRKESASTVASLFFLFFFFFFFFFWQLELKMFTLLLSEFVSWHAFVVTYRTNELWIVKSLECGFPTVQSYKKSGVDKLTW